MKNRNNVLVIGPWVSGHIQQWIGNDSSYNYTVVTCHKDKNKKPTMVHNLFFINRLISFSILPFALIYYYFLVKPKIIHVHYLSSYGLISSFLPGKKLFLFGEVISIKLLMQILCLGLFTVLYFIDITLLTPQENI